MRGKPYLDSVVYKWGFSALELTDALQNNDVDLVPQFVDPDRIEELEATVGTTVTLTEAADYRYFCLNHNNPILSNKTVRKAMMHAVNRTKIVAQVMKGYATVATGPLPPSFIDWYNPNVASYECNKTLSELLLNQTYPRNPEWRFNLTIKAHPGHASSPLSLGILHSVRDDLRDVGINATIEYDPDYFVAIDTGQFDTVTIAWTYDAYSPDDLYIMFHTNVLGNYGNYSNPELDVLLEQGKTSLNETERKVIFSQAQEIIAEDLPNLFLYNRHEAKAFNNDFHGHLENPSIIPITQYILEKTWYDPTLSGEGHSPMHISFVDSEGRRTGYDPLSGQAVNEIPNSTYSGLDSDPQLVKIRSPQGEYTVECHGTGNGSYSLEIVNIALGYKYVDIPTSYIHVNETHTYYVRIHLNGMMDVFNPVADINDDFVIDIFDAVLLASAFGSEPEDPNWDSNSDLNNDETVDIFDAIILAGHFGESW